MRFTAISVDIGITYPYLFLTTYMKNTFKYSMPRCQMSVYPDLALFYALLVQGCMFNAITKYVDHPLEAKVT